MKNKEYMSIKKMIEYIDKALRYTYKCSFKDFSNNEEKIDATVFSISQIGELVKNISKETMKKYPNIDWIIIKNLRNKIVHDYEGIKLNFIWKTADKKPVKNKELWEELYNLSKIHKIQFIKVKGHANNEYNNRCDELARNAIK